MDAITPQTIVDQPIPLIDGSILDSSGQASNPIISGAATPITQVDKKFPPRIIAHETLSQSLDTQTKRIKGAYSFESLGAISIGEFSQGVSGEVKISPDGIVAKNINGDTTFALNGTTGDATFRGTIEAADFIIADENGLISLANFTQSGFVDNNLAQSITVNNVDTDITGALVTFTLDRAVIVLFPFLISGYTIESGGNTCHAYCFLSIDGIQIHSAYRSLFNSGSTSGRTQSVLYIANTLAAGPHTVKLQAHMDVTSGSPSFTIFSFALNYLILGS